MIELRAAPATLPAGQRVYAIGDVHGCFERLVAMHEQIAADLAERPVEHAVLIHLGDYVDRGMESAQVVEWLVAGPPVPVQQVVNLMGNHEHMMLAAIAQADAEAADLWLRNGGADSLMSWGVARTVPAAGLGRAHPGAAPGLPARPGHAPPHRSLPVRPCRHPARRAAARADAAGPAVDPRTVPVLEAGSRRSGRAWPFTAARAVTSAPIALVSIPAR